jgi:hypothetical protein
MRRLVARDDRDGQFHAGKCISAIGRGMLQEARSDLLISCLTAVISSS